MLLRDLFDQPQLMRNFRLRPLDFDDEQRLAHRIPRLGKGLAGLDTGAVHELDRDRQHAGLDDVRHAGPRDLIAVKGDERGARAFWFAQDTQGRLGHHAQLALAATDHTQQIQPTCVQMRATNLDHGAIHHHHRHPKEVVGGHTVLKTMRPARVHGDIARDRTSQLRGWIRRIEEILFFHRARDRKVCASGLHPDDAIGVIGFQNLVHSCHTEDHTIGGWQCPTGKRRPSSARHHRHSHVVTDPQHIRHLLGRAWQHSQHRRAFVGRQRITLIGARLRLIRDQRIIGQHLLQSFQQLGLSGQDGGIGGGHLHAGSPLW